MVLARWGRGEEESSSGGLELTVADDHQLAFELAREAGQRLLALRASSGLSADALKNAGDRLSHDYLMAELARLRPGDAVLSEEGTDDQGRLAAPRVWIVDPLDGTKEFIRKIPEFCVAIGLSDRGEPVVGVTYNPVTEEMFWSARGMGCHLGSHRVRVTRTRMLHRASVLASRSETARGEWEVFHGILKSVPTGSVAYKLAMVAGGKADATFTRSPKNEWDIASGAALIIEAGGKMTDIDGKPLTFNKKVTKCAGMIASNGILHEQLLKVAPRHVTIPKK
jgi:myo-inositol-1(or 4)-monophosphatase